MSWGAWILLIIYPAAGLLGLGSMPEAMRDQVRGWGLVQRLPLRRLLDWAWRLGDRHRKTLLWTNIAAGAGLGVYTGLLLGTMVARIQWNSAVLGPLFLASGISTGAAFMLLFKVGEEEQHTLVRWDMIAIVAELFFIALMLISFAGGNATAQIAGENLLGGKWTALFWSLVVIMGLAYPLVEGLYLATPLDEVRFPELLNIPHAVLGAGVVVMAVGAFLGGEWMERFMARKNNSEPPDVAPRTRNKVFAVLGALAVLALLTLPLEPRSQAEMPAKLIRNVVALDLAQMLLRDPTSLHLVDLRDPAACKRKTIPGAICLPQDGSGAGFIADLPATRKLVLFSQGELAKLPSSAARFEGPVLALVGGFDSFAAAVLSKPTAPENPTVAALDQYRLRHALYGHFTGVRAQAQAITVKPMKVKRKLKKGGGC